MVELARPLQKIASGDDGGGWVRFALKGRDRSLACRSLEALEEAAWPRDVTALRFEARGERGKEIALYASEELFGPHKVDISGQDPLWVQGVAQHFRDTLNDCRNWHWLVNNWVVLLLLALVGAPFWVQRLFPHVEVHSSVPSRAAVLRRRAASALGILLLAVGVGILSAVVYNLLM
ncbi:MAG: hypothetical protein ACUVV3_04090 [Dehalococcoidia bacterium]